MISIRMTKSEMISIRLSIVPSCSVTLMLDLILSLI